MIPTEERKYQPVVPTIKTPEDAQMIQEFVNEAQRLLDTTKGVFENLKTSPQNAELIDSAFKVFHMIHGLAGFLDLQDIKLLSGETEKLINLVRKKHIEATPQLIDLILRAAGDLGRLLSLLKEQLNNDGVLNKPYYDIGFTIEQIRMITELPLDVVAERKGKVLPKKPIAVKPIEGPAQKAKERKSLVERYQKLEQEYNKLLQKIKEKEGDAASEDIEKRNAFFVNTAHEIRVLLNVILGFSKLLERSSLGPKEKEYIETIISSGELLLNIVNGVLDFSKIETGHLILEAIEFDLEELLQFVHRVIQAKKKNAGIEIRYQRAGDVPRKIIGDPTRLKQILINLMDNALKFTAEGNVTLEVSLSEAMQKGFIPPDEVEILFAVRDTGIGIPEDKQEKIFESFVQADDSITRQYGGTGLGLAICRSFIEAMGGKMWVASKVGVGSTFFFTARFKLAEGEPQIGQADEIHEEDALSDEELEKVSCPGVRILVAEDSITNQELMAIYFEQFGCTGDFAKDGKEAIEKIKANTYDLCFMDVEMPVMNGIEATKVIRNEIKSDIPIIALTAAVMDEEREKCLDVGMTDYLAKPFDIYSLKRKIIKHTHKNTKRM